MYFVVVVGGHAPTAAHMQRSEDNFQELLLTFHLVGAENQSQVWSSGLMTSIFFFPLSYLLVLLFYSSEGLLGIELSLSMLG